MITLEVCCGSYEDCMNAYNGNAKRVELNSSLFLGGITPSLGSLVLTKKNTDLEVICMVRPRGAGFYYTEVEYEGMLVDAKLLMEHGADGLAFGFLHEDKTVDVERTKEMVDLIHKYNGQAVFHRAFDMIDDKDTAIEQLIALGVDRILTSGGYPTAPEGIEVLAHLQAHYGDKIQLLAGGGVHPHNVIELIEKTGLTQVHSSCKEWIVDPTTIAKRNSCSYNKDMYDIVSEDRVRILKEKIDEYGNV